MDAIFEKEDWEDGPKKFELSYVPEFGLLDGMLILGKKLTRVPFLVSTQRYYCGSTSDGETFWVSLFTLVLINNITTHHQRKDPDLVTRAVEQESVLSCCNPIQSNSIQSNNHG
jgi:hypothetical protein